MLIITDKDENKRIDKYLVEQTEYTRSKIQKMIDNQNILVNGQSIKANYLLKKQDVISLEELTEDVDIEPENIPLDIYYEDDDLIVVNKPSGMVVHPAPGNYT